MKTFGIISTIFLLMLIKLSLSNTVVVQQQGFTFSPDTVNVAVGDTVKWVWTALVHTTTSVTIPAGAAPWSAPLDSAHTTFSYKVTVAGIYNYHCNFHYPFGMVGVISVSTTAIEPVIGIIPDKFQLYQNFPNPFNPKTSIKFDLPLRAQVRLNIFDISGEVVATLVNTKLQAGSYMVDWDASNNSSGVYFYQIQTPGFTFTKKLVLVK